MGDAFPAEVLIPAEVAIPAATGEGDALPPEVLIVSDMIVPIPTAEGSGTALAPTVGTGVTTDVPSAFGSGAVVAPATISVGVTTTLSTATGSGTAPAPDITAVSASFVAATSAASTTLTLPTHQAGDLIIIIATTRYAYSAAMPTLPAGWASIRADSGGANSFGRVRIASLVATGSDTTSGTWTGAETLTAMVYRGFSGVGATSYAQSANAASAPLARPTLTIAATSWAIAVAHAGDWYIQPTDIADPAATPATARAAYTNTSALTRTEMWDSGSAVGSTTVATSSQAITWASATDYGVRSWMAHLIELTV